MLHDFAVESSICYIQARQLIEGDSSVHGSAFLQDTPYRPLLLEKLILHIAALFAMSPKIKMKEITSQLAEWGPGGFAEPRRQDGGNNQFARQRLNFSNSNWTLGSVICETPIR